MRLRNPDAEATGSCKHLSHHEPAERAGSHRPRHKRKRSEEGPQRELSETRRRFLEPPVRSIKGETEPLVTKNTGIKDGSLKSDTAGRKPGVAGSEEEDARRPGSQQGPQTRAYGPRHQGLAQRGQAWKPTRGKLKSKLEAGGKRYLEPAPATELS